MARPWVKWYFADWRDPKLKMCGLAARGLWADLLTFMHEGEPYGHLVIEGCVPTIDQIASLVGRPVKEVRAALAELERYGVPSRDARGALYSRRMLKDQKRDAERSERGKLGGNPALKSEDNLDDNRDDKPQKLEARTRSQIEPKASPLAEPADLWKQVWESGRAYLTANGQSEGDARQALMRWRQNHHETDILRALKTAQSNAVELPIPYINTLLSGKEKSNGPGLNGRTPLATIRAKTLAAREDEARRTNLHES